MDRVVQSPGVGSHHEVYLFCDLSVLVGVAISLNNTHSKYFAIRKERTTKVNNDNLINKIVDNVEGPF